jgi:hypothetical protein
MYEQPRGQVFRARNHRDGPPPVVGEGTSLSCGVSATSGSFRGRWTLGILSPEPRTREGPLRGLPAAPVPRLLCDRPPPCILHARSIHASINQASARSRQCRSTSTSVRPVGEGPSNWWLRARSSPPARSAGRAASIAFLPPSPRRGVPRPRARLARRLAGVLPQRPASRAGARLGLSTRLHQKLAAPSA